MSDSCTAASPETEFAGGGTGAVAAMGSMDGALATILVIEDHKSTRTFLADNLTADGYELLEADCASMARHLIETAFPDLAIVDLGLPDADGLTLLRWVREADRACSHTDPDLPML